MCWYCCISLRGAVYFGTSIHIFVGLVLFVKWVLHTYTVTYASTRFLEELSVLIFTSVSGVYILLFILLGCLIFAGTERQSVGLLKWSTCSFILLQGAIFTATLVAYLWAPGEMWALLFNPNDSSEELFHVLVIAMYACCLVATLNYILVLFLYMRKLTSSSSSSAAGKRSSSSLHISHPIIQATATTTNATTPLGGQSTSAAASNNTTLTTNLSTSGGGGGGGVVYGYSRKRPQVVHQHQQNAVPDSPGIYESLDAHSMSSPYHPASYYSSGYSGNGNTRLIGQEGIYNGGSSIRSGIYYSHLMAQQHQQRQYPYPHQRYREPLLPTSPSPLPSTSGEDRAGYHHSLEPEVPGQDWMGAYGTRLQMYQTNKGTGTNGTSEPLLQNPQQNPPILATGNY